MNFENITLKNQEGKDLKISDLRGKWIILYFYPKDDTPGCTIEAQEFSRLKKEFDRSGTVIVGVSPDSIESHAKFAKKYSINFSILSDPDKTLLKHFGAFGKKKLYGRVYEGVIKSTFLINPEWKIAHSWKSVRAKGHARKVLNKLKEVA